MENRTTLGFNRVFDLSRRELFLKIQLGKKAGEEAVLECVQFSA